jgi:hypothetical protein
MHVRSTRLDTDSLAYLQSVEQTNGGGHAGVFVRRLGPAHDRANPRAGSVPLVLLGLAALGVAAYLVRPAVLDAGDLGRVAAWQAGLAAGGVLALLLGLARLTRRVPPAPLGSFLFADALHLWDVAHDRVTATPLDDLRDADCYHTLVGGSRAYLGSRVELTTRAGKQSVHLTDRGAAERLGRFLYALVVLRRDGSEVKASPPALLGAVAHKLAGGDELPGESFRDPPRPARAAGPTAPEPAGLGRRAAAAGLAAAAAGLAGWFAFPALDAAVLERHLYAKVPAADTGRFDEIDHYLAKLPDGKRAGEVRDLRDDRRFARAVKESAGRNSPAALRDYLADGANTRHRPEEQKRINVYYDRAIADLKARAARGATRTRSWWRRSSACWRG